MKVKFKLSVELVADRWKGGRHVRSGEKMEK
jgi:hypothetical protein